MIWFCVIRKTYLTILLLCDHCKCRAIAAVVVGNPDSYIGVQVSFANRWQHLLERKIDVLIRYDTYTIEREIKEVRITPLYLVLFLSYPHLRRCPFSTYIAL